MLWFIFKGNPHWDGNKPFSFAKHLYKGGMWFKKKRVIKAENSLNDATMRDKYDGKDYRPVGKEWPRVNNSIASGTPANVDDYFFLPATVFFLPLLSLMGYVWKNISISSNIKCSH